MTFRTASLPFNHKRQNTRNLMLQVIVACLPGLLVMVYCFGYGILSHLLLASITALLAEGLVVLLRKRHPLGQLKDGSALLTGVLLALVIPPSASWWMIILATAFAIIIAKQLYGGLGHNPFNPAMVGYVMLLISFPGQMTHWLPTIGLHLSPNSTMETLTMIVNGHTPGTYDLLPHRFGFDGITYATPRDALETVALSETMDRADPQKVIKHHVLNWAWINVGFMIGGLYLLCRRVINWTIPVAYLGGLTLCATFGQWLAPVRCAPTSIHLFSGTTMLGAFFIATDPVTASTTVKGRVIFGAMIGLLVWLIRTYGSYPDGVAFAVLLANICVPLIGYCTQPRAYGHR